jgi:hypothetical protein
LNIINNISKSIDFLVIIFLEYLESIIFFLVFCFLISTKVRVDNKTRLGNDPGWIDPKRDCPLRPERPYNYRELIGYFILYL